MGRANRAGSVSRSWWVAILVVAALLCAPLALADEAATPAPSGEPALVAASVTPADGTARVPPYVWILILGATLVGLRSMRS